MTRPRPSRAAAGATAAALLLVLSACSSPAPAPPAAAAPDGASPGGLVAKAATVDLGRVPFNQQVEARFELTNTGGKPIKLTAQPRVQMLEGC